MVLVRATVLDDWQAMREIRLRALRDAPDAFGSSYAREIAETNKPALRLYERCGFTATPERQPLPSNPALGELGMTRPLVRVESHIRGRPGAAGAPLVTHASCAGRPRT